MAAGLRAQTTAQVPASPTAYVFHVWVDPLFGDDVAASKQNPGVNGNQLPLSFHPDNATTNRPVGGVLQNAPFSFRTLTRPKTGSSPNMTMGAIEYVKEVFRQSPTAPFFLPWFHPTHSPGVSVDFVVIHMMPGLYGPIPSGLPVRDPESGLPFNGEPDLPIDLPNGVSLQGTSALDTILDGRMQGTALIKLVNNDLIVLAPTHNASFIDGLTLRNAKDTTQPNATNRNPTTGGSNMTGAAIYLGRSTEVYVTISNCFITNNVIGIGIDSPRGTAQGGGPRIVNNTIAWNRIGIWNGNLAVATGSIGAAEPALVNNIIDSGNPPFAVARVSGFEGLRTQDLVTSSRTNATTAVFYNIDFNAWEYSVGTAGAVMTGAGVAHWPGTSPKGTPATFTPPRVDLLPFTHPLTPQPRGSLYINDIFRNAGIGVTAQRPQGQSPHDFRLALQVSTEATQAPNENGVYPQNLNPLVNRGIQLSGGFFLLNQANGFGFGGFPQWPYPGLTAVSTATFGAWDFDCDGYGNRRIVNRSLFPTFPSIDSVNIDIGADEADELTMAGYVDGTRMFTAPPNDPLKPTTGAPAGITRHDQVWFFDVYQGGPTTYSRPGAGVVPSRLFQWWPHVTAPTDTATGSNFSWGTASAWARFRHFSVTGALFMRNLECDISPYLIQDTHPFTTSMWPYHDSGLSYVDVYGTSPYYKTPLVTGSAQPIEYRNGQWDNQFLYHNPKTGTGPGYPKHTTYFGNTPASKQPATQYGGWDWSEIRAGHPNPPGTWDNLSNAWTLGLLYPFGPFGTCGSGGIEIGLWGMNDIWPCPDSLEALPGQDSAGTRYNVEYTGSNVQSFLVVLGAGASQSQAQSGSGFLPRLTTAQIHDLRNTQIHDLSERRQGKPSPYDSTRIQKTWTVRKPQSK